MRTLCGVLSTTWAGQLEAGVAGAEAEVEQGEVTGQRGVQAGEAGSAQQQGATCTKESLLKGMSEFWVGEVSLVCRKNILIHSKGPGFCYFEDNRFK